MHQIRPILILVAFLGCFPFLPGQTDSVKFDYDKAIRVAQELSWNKYFDDAKILARRVLQDKPEYIDARIVLANSLAWEGFPDEARQEYFAVFQYDNANKDAFQGLISLEVNMGQPLKAVEYAKKALEFHPEDTDLIMSYARSCQLSGNFIDAKKALLLILEMTPDYIPAKEMYLNIKRAIPVSTEGNIIPGFLGPYDIKDVDSVMAQANNFAANLMIEKSRELLTQILSMRPDFFPARLLFAETYAWENQFEEAREELKKVRVEENGYRQGIISWIRIETWAKNYTAAIRYCNLGINYYPTDKEFLLMKAEVYEKAGNLVEAKKTLFHYMASNPDDISFKQKYLLISDKAGQLYSKSKKPVPIDTTLLRKPINSLLEEARALAYDKRFDEAVSICLEILHASPDDFGAKLLLGNIRSWEGKFSEAISILVPLIQVAFDSKDLMLGIIDAEIWSENYDEARYWINYGLDIYPDEPDLLYRKATVYQRSGELTLAASTLAALVAKNPDNKEYRQAYYSVRGPLQINGMSAEYTINKYTIPDSVSWNIFGLKYYTSDKRKTLIGSANIGYLISDTTGFMQYPGVQFEIDAYPIFPEKKRYLHFNLGFSPSSIFARQKAGAHFFGEISKDWEVSGGLNYLRFRDDLDTVHVFTAEAGVAHYFKNYMASAGLYLGPANQELALGANLTIRYFLKTPEDWIQLTFGTGMFPDNPLYYLNDPAFMPTQRLKSYHAVFAGRYWFSKKLIGRIYAGYHYEEYRQTFFRNSGTLNLALIYLFKD